MGYFAEIIDNTVRRVLAVPDAQDHRGQQYLASDLALGGTWVQCSYNTRGGVHYGPDGKPDGGPQLHYNYPGIGSQWDADAGAFHAPQPFPSWALDSGFLWQPPTPRPDDGRNYYWDEAAGEWVAG